MSFGPCKKLPRSEKKKVCLPLSISTERLSLYASVLPFDIEQHVSNYLLLRVNLSPNILCLRARIKMAFENIVETWKIILITMTILINLAAFHLSSANAFILEESKRLSSVEIVF